MNLAPRYHQVLVDVRRQRLQRRDVDDAHLIRQRALLHAFAQELIEGGQEGGERLAGAGGRGDERIVAAPNSAPAVELCLSRFCEPAGPPLAQDRRKIEGQQACYFYIRLRHSFMPHNSLTSPDRKEL